MCLVNWLALGEPLGRPSPSLAFASLSSSRVSYQFHKCTWRRQERLAGDSPALQTGTCFQSLPSFRPPPSAWWQEAQGSSDSLSFHLLHYSQGQKGVTLPVYFPEVCLWKNISAFVETPLLVCLTAGASIVQQQAFSLPVSPELFNLQVVWETFLLLFCKMVSQSVSKSTAIKKNEHRADSSLI